jgi:hypothetical protein
MNNQDPHWQTGFELDYYFERTQNIKFRVMDLDDINKDDLIGEAETTIGKILGTSSQVIKLDLTANGNKGRGKVAARIESVQETNMTYMLDTEFINPGNVTKGCCGSKVNPISVQFQRNIGGEWKKSWQSLPINSKTARSGVMTVPFSKMCNEDLNEKIRICLVNPETGVVYNSSEMLAGQIATDDTFATAHHGGSVKFHHRELVRKPTFIDYLRSGYSIGFTTAIDYTLSNGLPTNSSSLHFLGAQINEYEQSLLQVGSVIEPYDSDMLFPVYGFGGIPRYMGIN